MMRIPAGVVVRHVLSCSAAAAGDWCNQWSGCAMAVGIQPHHAITQLCSSSAAAAALSPATRVPLHLMDPAAGAAAAAAAAAGDLSGRADVAGLGAHATSIPSSRQAHT
jgi:hypothetical protein